MFFDLNVPVPTVSQPSKREQAGAVYNAAQLSAIEARLDLLVHLGYTVVAFNQVAYKKIEKKTHIDTLGPLLKHLRPRSGVVFLKRLTIVLDEDSEKGFGLTNANASLFAPYDLISLTPTTSATFSAACLTHSLPSPLTAHLITVPLTSPRLPFNLKHTLVRTAIKNGAMFEINFAGALGVESPVECASPSSLEGAASIKRNWWAAAREVMRVTKGRGVLVSGGIVNPSDVRAPRDVANVITLLGVAQDIAQKSLTRAPKSLVLRAQSRKTYRGMYSVTRSIITTDPAPQATRDEEPEPLQSLSDKEPQSLDVSVADLGTVPKKRVSEELDKPNERPRKKKKKEKGKA